MSSRNTPVNLKYSKACGTVSTKVSGNVATTMTPTRNTLGAIKSSNPSDAKMLLKKQISSCDLREARKHDDDILNTAFASSPVLSKIQKFQLKSKSTTTINSFSTPSSLSKPLSTVTTPRPSVFKNTPVSTPRTVPAKRLFFNSTGGGYGDSATATRTPDCHTKSSASLAPTPRSHSKSSDEELKMRDSSEISNLTVAVRVRPMNTKECTITSVTNVVSVDDNEVTVLAGINADSSAGVSHSFHYDHAFWSCNPNHENYADQETVFRGTTIPLVDKAFEGYNACLFAYGQTGSGKSYSMMGIDNGNCEP